jgi:hypothetical protein
MHLPYFFRWRWAFGVGLLTIAEIRIETMMAIIIMAAGCGFQEPLIRRLEAVQIRTTGDDYLNNLVGGGSAIGGLTFPLCSSSHSHDL